MGKHLYTSLHYVTYILQGVVLLFAFDLVFDLPDNLGDRLTIDQIEGMDVFFAFAIAFVLGHVNSLIAHLVFQEGMTALGLGRPSHHLLCGNEHHWFSYCRSFSALTKRRIWDKAIRTGALDEGMQSKSPDRRVFAAAFAWAHRDASFADQLDSLLSSFNFSRNMACCLLIAVLILSVKSTCTVATIGSMGEDTFFCWLSVALLIVAILLFVRYLYFLRALTKQILLNFLDQPEPVPAIPASPTLPMIEPGNRTLFPAAT